AARYRIGRELGRGGMATVYLADDLPHRRSVAVKVLRPDLVGGISADRFLREIEITAQLLHPHILTLIDSGEADGLLYYVMPYVEGESLRSRLDREGELPIQDATRILREVVDALAYAHGRGIVHRDIKPENVLLTGDHALVADFGVAKALARATGHERATSDPTALTELGMVLGTPAYMAPEQAAGDPHIDQRADVYAAGVLAYEMLAGEPPFTGPNARHVMAAHLTRVPEPLARLRPSVAPALEQLVMRCLEKRPADRWQNGAELLRGLDAIAVPVIEPTNGPRGREPVERTFRLTEDVCRKLNRASLDPRMIGDVQHYLDNEVDSPVLVCFVHGTGYDQRQFERTLKLAPYRALAPTLYGFEPVAARRHVLSLDDHLVILRAFVRDAVARLRPEITLLVGFSSGADAVLRLLAADVADETADDTADARVPRPLVDGALALGANVSLGTCFVTRLLGRMDAENPRLLLDGLRSLSTGADTLHEWLNIHEYLVATLRKFGGDIAPLRRYSADIVEPFEAEGASPFPTWYRSASARVRRLRCVFEDTAMIEGPLRALRIQNMDERIFGPWYREDSIVIEPGTDHFDLNRPELVLRHVEEMVRMLREP
ncbi:MAG: serine/threonine-protein kinase, partial [Gemmatimonadaceae bacterium]